MNSTASNSTPQGTNVRQCTLHVPTMAGTAEEDMERYGRGNCQEGAHGKDRCEMEANRQIWTRQMAV